MLLLKTFIFLNLRTYLIYFILTQIFYDSIIIIIFRFSILVSISIILVLQNVLPNLSNLNPTASSLNTFINNSLGYCLILIPGYWLYKFSKNQDLGGK